MVDGLFGDVVAVTEKVRLSEKCPARDTDTRRCHGRSWFTGKGAKSMPCQGRQCPWKDKVIEHFKRKERKTK